MPYVGFVRNGRLNYQRVGNIEAWRKNHAPNREEAWYRESVRLLDDRTGTYWKFAGDHWEEGTAGDGDETVERMAADLGLQFDSPVPALRRIERRPEPLPVAQPETLVYSEPRRPETVVDLRTYTAGVARRKGRRKR